MNRTNTAVSLVLDGLTEVYTTLLVRSGDAQRYRILSREHAQDEGPRRVVMRKAFFTVALTVLLVIGMSSGCAYMKVQRPHDKNYDNTELGTKEGRSSLQSIFWFVAWGDAGSRAAAEQGGITVIKHADVEYYMLLGGLYTRVTTVVYGD